MGHLRTVAPVPRGCVATITQVPGLDSLGYTSKHRRRFYIEIRASLSHRAAEQILLHEWAHMLDWRPYHPLTRDHGATWGVWLASVYCAYFGVT